MKKFILLILILLLSSSSSAGTDTTVTLRKLGIAEFIADPGAAQPLSQRELVMLTEYLTNMLKQRTTVTIIGRDAMDRLPNDPTVPLKQRYQEIGKYSKVDAVLGATVTRSPDNSIIISFIVISTKENTDEEFTGIYKDFQPDGKSLKEQFLPIKEDVMNAFMNVVEGRSFFAPPDFRKIKFGVTISDFIGFNNIFYLKNEDSKNFGSFFKANYQIMSGTIHLSLSPNVFMNIGALILDATDKYQTNDDVYTLRDIKSDPAYKSFWLPGGRNLFDVLDTASFNDNKSATLLRNGTRAFYAGGGLGIRFWKIRMGATYYASLHNILPDLLTKHKVLNPPFIVSGSLDIYLLNTIFVGVSYYFANAGVVDNKIDAVFPNGVPATYNNVEELGIKRRQVLSVDNVILHAGFEL